LNDGFPYLIAGKSGTAERFSRTSEAYDTNKNTAYLATRHRAWFMGYTPSDDPQIATAVVLEAGAWGGTDAGPIMRRIFDAWAAAKGAVLPAETPPPATLPAAGSAVEDLPAQASSSEGTIP
jgi:penicillin-binding protein 2